jgi:hypothetical protein
MRRQCCNTDGAVIRKTHKRMKNPNQEQNNGTTRLRKAHQGGTRPFGIKPEPSSGRLGGEGESSTRLGIGSVQAERGEPHEVTADHSTQRPLGKRASRELKIGGERWYFQRLEMRIGKTLIRLSEDSPFAANVTAVLRERYPKRQSEMRSLLRQAEAAVLDEELQRAEEEILSAVLVHVEALCGTNKPAHRRAAMRLRHMLKTLAV